MKAETPSNDSTPFELQCMKEAVEYQKWMMELVSPYIGKSVLELGAGIGNMSRHFPDDRELFFSEIDESLIPNLKQAVERKKNATVIHLKKDSSLAGIPELNRLDTIISFNVFEHVKEDWSLMQECLELLKSSKAAGEKNFISVVPAHEWAFGEIDRSFDHFRRYTASTFRRSLVRAGAVISPENFHYQYINMPGLFAWWLRGRLLKKNSIGIDSIKYFEKLCPIIRPLDNFLHKQLRFPLGNSLLAVYKIV